MTDKSAITQQELSRHGMNSVDNDTITKFKLLLDKRVYLKDSDYTTMSDKEWINHFRNSLVELLNSRD